MDVRLRGDHLLLRRDDSLILRANADLHLTGTWEQAQVSGTLGVVDSLFFRDIELLPIGSPFTVPSAAELPKIDTAKSPTGSVPEPFRNWSLDVTLSTDEPFLIRGNLATGRITGSVRVGGTIGDPRARRRGADQGFQSIAAIQHAHGALGQSGLHSGVRHRSAVGNPRHRRAAALSGECVCLRPRVRSAARADVKPAAAGKRNHDAAGHRHHHLRAGGPAGGIVARAAIAGRGTPPRTLRLRQATPAAAFRCWTASISPWLRRIRIRASSFSTATLELTDRWYLTAGMGEEGNSRVLAIWRLRFY